MEDGQDPDLLFVGVDPVADKVQAMGELITGHRKMDIVLGGIRDDYDLVNVQATMDSRFSLDDLETTIRNMYVNQFPRARRGVGVHHFGHRVQSCCQVA